MKKLHLLIILLMPLCAFGNCIFSSDDDNIIDDTGTVKFIQLEGGFYGIVADNGKNYLPINLAPEFKVDRLRVRFKAKIRDDLASIYMWGTIIEILRIEEL